MREYSREDYVFVQHKVRAKLKEFGCARAGSSKRARWVVDEDMAKRVSEALGMPLR